MSTCIGANRAEVSAEGGGGRGAEVAVVQRRSGEGALQRNQQKKTNRSCTQVG